MTKNFVIRLYALAASRLRFFAVTLLLAGGSAVPAAEEFLDPQVAFKLTASAVDARTVEVSFNVSPGYYLYQDQFRFSAKGVELGAPVYPPGKVKFDETFQKNVEIHRGVVRIAVPVQQAPPAFVLMVTNQGCADKGLCYPPMQRAVKVSLAAFGGNDTLRVLNVAETAALSSSGSDPGTAATTPTGAVTGAVAGSAKVAAVTTTAADEVLKLDAALRGGRFWTVALVFFVAGVLLSLTPCVLPMLPILSSIIVGQGAQVSRGRGLSLAASYSLGMATVYTALGIAAGLAGEGLAATLQNPWMLGLFAAGLVALSLSMFGVYELQLPSAFTGHLTRASQRLPAGRVLSVFVMGGVSALIVSPCVAAPLAGALVYLSQTRNVWLGGTALFSLAAGMSVPLLLVGASAGAILPGAGAWMHELKRFFGLMLLGVALWTVAPVLPGELSLALWGALALCAAVLFMSHGHGHHIGWSRSLWRRTVAAVLAVCGLLQMAGAASGGRDPLQPLAHLAARNGGQAASAELRFVTVRSIAELDAALLGAGRPTMLDFYADWCVSCKEMDRFTFADPAVRAKLAGALLLRADVTANNAGDRELLKRFALFGPPGTLFFDSTGREISQARVVGYQNSERFVQTLNMVGL
jgi:thiol:disulfide interchange protein DsbD